ncbi:MAG: hypothetical protein K9K64_09620 [Desulfohalobiaceae bacterium]|nr:hypothetical protein [Desulfohalobiaceae bacterium]
MKERFTEKRLRGFTVHGSRLEKGRKNSKCLISGSVSVSLSASIGEVPGSRFTVENKKRKRFLSTNIHESARIKNKIPSLLIAGWKASPAARGKNLFSPGDQFSQCAIGAWNNL